MIEGSSASQPDGMDKSIIVDSKNDLALIGRERPGIEIRRCSHLWDRGIALVPRAARVGIPAIGVIGSTISAPLRYRSVSESAGDGTMQRCLACCISLMWDGGGSRKAFWSNQLKTRRPARMMENPIRRDLPKVY